MRDVKDGRRRLLPVCSVLRWRVCAPRIQYKTIYADDYNYVCGGAACVKLPICLCVWHRRQIQFQILFFFLSL